MSDKAAQNTALDGTRVFSIQSLGNIIIIIDDWWR